MIFNSFSWFPLLLVSTDFQVVSFGTVWFLTNFLWFLSGFKAVSKRFQSSFQCFSLVSTGFQRDYRYQLSGISFSWGWGYYWNPLAYTGFHWKPLIFQWFKLVSTGFQLFLDGFYWFRVVSRWSPLVFCWFPPSFQRIFIGFTGEKNSEKQWKRTTKMLETSWKPPETTGNQCKPARNKWR